MIVVALHPDDILAIAAVLLIFVILHRLRGRGRR